MRNFLLSFLVAFVGTLIFLLSGPNYIQYKQTQNELKKTVSDINEYIAANPNLVSGDAVADRKFAEAYKQLTSMQLPINASIPTSQAPASTPDADPLIARIVRVETQIGALTTNFNEYKEGQPSFFVTGVLCPLLILLVFEFLKPFVEKYGLQVFKKIHGEHKN